MPLRTVTIEEVVKAPPFSFAMARASGRNFACRLGYHIVGMKNPAAPISRRGQD